VTCTWLIEVASGNPEPDSYADTIKHIECGAPLTTNEYGSYSCTNGHRHVSFDDPERGAFELELIAEERSAEREDF
jgi:hypothetical protein